MTPPELKLCPFCGGTNIERGSSGWGQVYHECQSCGARGPSSLVSFANHCLPDPAKWNTRTASIPDPMTDPRVVALVEAGNRLADMRNRYNGDRDGPAWRQFSAALADMKGQKE